MIKARSARSKGNRLEKWLVTFCEQLGLKARKQPGDTLEDLFPGTHGVGAAWAEWVGGKSPLSPLPLEGGS